MLSDTQLGDHQPIFSLNESLVTGLTREVKRLTTASVKTSPAGFPRKDSPAGIPRKQTLHHGSQRQTLKQESQGKTDTALKAKHANVSICRLDTVVVVQQSCKTRTSAGRSLLGSLFMNEEQKTVGF